MKAYVDDLKRQIEGGAASAKQRNEAYDAVMSYRRPSWTIAAFVRQGRVYEILAKAVLNTPFAVPADLKKQMSKLGIDSVCEVFTEACGHVRDLRCELENC